VIEIERLSFGGDSWDRSMFLEYFERYPELFLIAKAGRRIAGYSITCVTGERAELASIAVDPVYRTHGVATALVRYTAGELQRRRVRNWHLMVRIANKPAIRFYKRFGFVRTKTVRNYYADGGDAWRMRWKVPC
jgi:ribosomal-protein-alanine N-acetyltransferase